jgi:hypothetical protein
MSPPKSSSTWSAQASVTAIRGRLRTTERIAAVVVVYRESFVSPIGGAVALKFWTQLNDRVALPAEAVALLQSFPAKPGAWVALESIALQGNER